MAAKPIVKYYQKVIYKVNSEVTFYEKLFLVKVFFRTFEVAMYLDIPKKYNLPTTIRHPSRDMWYQTILDDRKS